MMNETKTVEEMEAYDFDLISDLHKDAFGFRPSAEYMRHFNSLSFEEKKAAWDSLCETVDYECERERREAEEATKNKMAYFLEVQEKYGVDLETAIRWDMEAEKADTVDYYEYLIGVPYGTIARLFERENLA